MSACYELGGPEDQSTNSLKYNAPIIQLKQIMLQYVALIFFCLRYISCQGMSENGRIRALLVTVDNRELSTDFESPNYWSLAAAINMHYAKSHSYDYLYVNVGVGGNGTQDSVDEAIQQSIEKYNISAELLSLAEKDVESHDHKHNIASFNFQIQQFRASSWSKLLVIWKLLQNPRTVEKYDYIFFIDSDALISPLPELSKRSLDDLFREVDSPGNTEYGPLPSKASLVVLYVLNVLRSQLHMDNCS